MVGGLLLGIVGDIYGELVLGRIVAGRRESMGKVMGESERTAVIKCEECGIPSYVEEWYGRYSEEDRCYYYKCPHCGHEVEG